MSRKALLAGAALACGACDVFYDPCFTPPGEIHSEQVLAIRADPPEAHRSPTPEAVAVRALVADPSQQLHPVAVAARLCPSETSCDPSAPAFQAPAYTEQSFTVQTPAQLVDAALAQDPLHGYGGIRVQLRFEALGQTSTKLLLYSDVPEDQRNHGLEITGLLYGADRDALQPLTGDHLALSVSKAVWIRPLVGPGPGAAAAAETYTTTDLAGHQVTLTEHISYSFYAPADLTLGGEQTFTGQGSTDGVGGLGPGNQVDDPGDGGTRGLFQIRPVHQGGSVGTLWIVARDGRGGVAWTSVPYQAIEERPECQEQGSGSCPLLEIGCR